MIISCPSCDTRYQVDEAKFPPRGRTVRCAKCSNSWHQPAPEPEASPELAVMAPEPAPVPVPQQAAAEPEPEPVRQRPPSIGSHYHPPQPAAAPRENLRAHLPELRGSILPVLAVVGGWLGLIAIVLVIAFSAVRYRQDIAAIWPQSAGVYSSLGMKVNPSAIDFRNVDYHREIEDGVVVLAVTGRIVNTGKRELPVPRMVEVSLSDANNHELYHWSFGSGAATLRPGQSVPFATRLSSPPIASRHLQLRFAKDGS
ncbi:MAG TPA: DUF3426 domain-containing protein [Rhizomicrobium sp.]|jgi:predicted Zn finger-like uncharacterized protein|nr:DUF3426 domain-containing protein [Rhizomicrobium sp.]